MSEIINEAITGAGEILEDGCERFNDYENNTASGTFTHAEGENTTAIGRATHAEGRGSRATAAGAHAEGWSSYATGADSHAEGESCQANGARSHAGGYYSFANYNNQTVIGTCNKNRADTLFEIGNGTPTARSNAFEVYADGSISVGGVVITPDRLRALINLIS